MDKSFRKGSRKGSDYARKGYKSKSHILELQAQNQQATLQRLQQESAFLQLKGTVLELLLEVASEIVVHKRKHINVAFPDLNDQQLLEFLDEFLGKYGGYNAVGPTERNLFHLERLKVEEYQTLTPKSFTDKYTALVQRLSLMLLQATDDTMKGGLMTTVADLKQLLIGALLWNPVVFHTVSAHHLVNGEVVGCDPEHSEITMSGVCLDVRQSEVLLIIAGMYSASVKKLEQSHAVLAAQLDSELTQDVPPNLAAVITRLSSNAYRLEATHQLYHTAVIQALMDQQLAHMCVRCFPRFPSFRDLLAALERINKHKAGATAATGNAAGLSLAAAATAAAAAAEAGVAADVNQAAAAAAGATGGSSAGGSAGDPAAAVKGGSAGSDSEHPAAASPGQQQPGRAAAMRQDSHNGNDSSKWGSEVRVGQAGAAAAPGCEQPAGVKVERTTAADRSAHVEYSSSSKPANAKRHAADAVTGDLYPLVKQGKSQYPSRQLPQSPVHPAAVAAASGLYPATGLAHMGELDPAAAAALPVPLPLEIAARINSSNSSAQQQQVALGHYHSTPHVMADSSTAAAAARSGAFGVGLNHTAAAAAAGTLETPSDPTAAALLMKQILHMMHSPSTTPAQQKQLSGALSQVVMQEQQRQAHQQQRQQQQHMPSGIDSLLQAALGSSMDPRSWPQQHQQQAIDSILARQQKQQHQQQQQHSQRDLLLAAMLQTNGVAAPPAADKLLESLLLQQQQQQQPQQQPQEQQHHQSWPQASQQQQAVQQQPSKAAGPAASQQQGGGEAPAVAGSSGSNPQQQLMSAVAEMLKAVNDVAEAAAAAEAAAVGSSNAATAAAEAALLAAANAIQGLRARASNGGAGFAARARGNSPAAASAGVTLGMSNNTLQPKSHQASRADANQTHASLDIKPLLGLTWSPGGLPSSAAAAAQPSGLGSGNYSSISKLLAGQQQASRSQQQQQQQDEQQAQQLANAVDALTQLSQVRDRNADAGPAAVTPAALKAEVQGTPPVVYKVAAAGQPATAQLKSAGVDSELAGRSNSTLVDLGLGAATAHGSTAGPVGRVLRSPSAGSATTSATHEAAGAAAEPGTAAAQKGHERSVQHQNQHQEQQQQHSEGLALLQQLQAGLGQPQQQQRASQLVNALATQQGLVRPSDSFGQDQLLSLVLGMLGAAAPAATAAGSDTSSAVAMTAALAAAVAQDASKQQPNSSNGGLTSSLQSMQGNAPHHGLAGLLDRLNAANSAAGAAGSNVDTIPMDYPGVIRTGSAGSGASSGPQDPAAAAAAPLPISNLRVSGQGLSGQLSELQDQVGNTNPLAALALAAANHQAKQQQHLQSGLSMEILDIMQRSLKAGSGSQAAAAAAREEDGAAAGMCDQVQGEAAAAVSE